MFTNSCVVRAIIFNADIKFDQFQILWGYTLLLRLVVHKTQCIKYVEF